MEQTPSLCYIRPCSGVAKTLGRKAPTPILFPSVVRPSPSFLLNPTPSSPISALLPLSYTNRPLSLRCPPFSLFPTQPDPFPSVVRPSPSFLLKPTPFSPISDLLPISYSTRPRPLLSPADSFLFLLSSLRSAAF